MCGLKESKELMNSHSNNNSQAGQVKPALQSKKKMNVVEMEPRKKRKLDLPVSCLELDSASPSMTINSLPEFLPNVRDEIYQKEEEEEAVGDVQLSLQSGSISDDQFDNIMKAMEKIHHTPDISLENEVMDTMTDNENNVPNQTPEKEEIETPETSPTLIDSILRQSGSGLHLQRKKEMSIVGRRGSQYQAGQTFSPARGRVTPRKLNFSDPPPLSSPQAPGLLMLRAANNFYTIILLFRAPEVKM